MAVLSKDITIKECTPLGYHVVVELHKIYAQDDDGNSTSEGGILFIQETVKKEQQAVHIGTVIEIGPWAHKNHSSGCDSPEDWGYGVGDLVRFNAYVGEPVTNDPKDLRRLVCDHDIKCKVTIEEVN